VLDVFPQGLAVDEDVIHIHDNELVDILGEEPVDALLKSSRSV